MTAARAPIATDVPLWTLPAGMRATRATRALEALFRAHPDAALSEPEVEAALVQVQVPVNKVTVYRMLDRFAAAGLLHKQIDRARITRFTLAAPGEEAQALPRFECDGCHRNFRLADGATRMQAAMKSMLQALASAGHEGNSVDIAVRGRCAGCAKPEPFPGQA